MYNFRTRSIKNYNESKTKCAGRNMSQLTNIKKETSDTVVISQTPLQTPQTKKLDLPQKHKIEKIKRKLSEPNNTDKELSIISDVTLRGPEDTVNLVNKNKKIKLSGDVTMKSISKVKIDLGTSTKSNNKNKNKNISNTLKNSPKASTSVHTYSEKNIFKTSEPSAKYSAVISASSSNKSPKSSVVISTKSNEKLSNKPSMKFSLKSETTLNDSLHSDNLNNTTLTDASDITLKRPLLNSEEDTNKCNDKREIQNTQLSQFNTAKPYIGSSVIAKRKYPNTFETLQKDIGDKVANEVSESSVEVRKVTEMENFFKKGDISKMECNQIFDNTILEMEKFLTSDNTLSILKNRPKSSTSVLSSSDENTVKSSEPSTSDYFADESNNKSITTSEKPVILGTRNSSIISTSSCYRSQKSSVVISTKSNETRSNTPSIDSSLESETTLNDLLHSDNHNQSKLTDASETTLLRSIINSEEDINKSNDKGKIHNRQLSQFDNGKTDNLNRTNLSDDSDITLIRPLVNSEEDTNKNKSNDKEEIYKRQLSQFDTGKTDNLNRTDLSDDSDITLIRPLVNSEEDTNKNKSNDKGEIHKRQLSQFDTGKTDNLNTIDLTDDSDITLIRPLVNSEEDTNKNKSNDKGEIHKRQLSQFDTGKTDNLNRTNLSDDSDITLIRPLINSEEDTNKNKSNDKGEIHKRQLSQFDTGKTDNLNRTNLSDDSDITLIRPLVNSEEDTNKNKSNNKGEIHKRQLSQFDTGKTDNLNRTNLSDDSDITLIRPLVNSEEDTNKNKSNDKGEIHKRQLSQFDTGKTDNLNRTNLSDDSDSTLIRPLVNSEEDTNKNKSNDKGEIHKRQLSQFDTGKTDNLNRTNLSDDSDITLIRPLINSEEDTNKNKSNNKGEIHKRQLSQFDTGKTDNLNRTNLSDDSDITLIRPLVNSEEDTNKNKSNDKGEIHKRQLSQFDTGKTDNLNTIDLTDDSDITLIRPLVNSEEDTNKNKSNDKGEIHKRQLSQFDTGKTDNLNTIDLTDDSDITLIRPLLNSEEDTNKSDGKGKFHKTQLSQFDTAKPYIESSVIAKRKHLNAFETLQKDTGKKVANNIPEISVQAQKVNEMENNSKENSSCKRDWEKIIQDPTLLKWEKFLTSGPTTSRINDGSSGSKNIVENTTKKLNQSENKNPESGTTVPNDVIICISDDEISLEESVNSDNSRISKPKIKVINNEVLKNINIHDNDDVSVMKQILLETKKKRALKENNTVDPLKNKTIINGNTSGQKIFKNLGKDLQQYKIPVEVKYGPTIRAQYKYTESSTTSTKKVNDLWDTMVPQDLKINKPRPINPQNPSVVSVHNNIVNTNSVENPRENPTTFCQNGVTSSASTVQHLGGRGQVQQQLSAIQNNVSKMTRWRTN